MLLVCANVSNLLLARAAARTRETTLRAALGARRGRLVRQQLTESVLLSGAGAALGAALGVALAAAVLTGLLFGVGPALRATGVAVRDTLQDAGRGASAGVRQGWTPAALVSAEVALACTLLVGAGLLVRSFLRVLDQELGFRPERAVAVRIDPSTRFPSGAQRTAFYDEALRPVRAAPGVSSAGLTDVLPMGFNRLWSVAIPGEEQRARGWPPAFVRVVSDGYLRAMGVALRAGRDFTAGDDSVAAPVVIVSETLARRTWPGEDPLGKQIDPGGWRIGRTVVGVVPALRYQALEEEGGADVYLPMRKMPDYAAVYVIARSAQPADALVAAVRAALRPLDATLALTEARPLQEIVDRSVSPRRLVAQPLAGFAAFAPVIASLGIYAVVSYDVAQRRREIGIRMALGATPRHVRSRVLARTLQLATVGLAVGLVAAWGLARVLRGLLFGVTAADPAAYAAALGALAGVAMLAGDLPARRASRLDPSDALRAE